MSTPLPPVPGIVWTRELLLQAAGFSTDLVRRAVQRTGEALDAERPTRTITRGDRVEVIEGGPDHPIRLEAARQVYELADLKRPREATGDVTAALAALQITLVVGEGRNGTNGHGGKPDGDAPAGLPYRHLRIRPRGGNGGGR